MGEPEGATEARRQLGRRLAERRKAAGYTQQGFAPLTGYGRSTVANVEVGRQHAPRDFWQRCDRALATGGTLVAAFDDIEHLIQRQRQDEARAAQAAREARVRRWRQAQEQGLQAMAPPMAWGAPSDGEADDEPELAEMVESPLVVLDRIRRLAGLRVTDSLLDALDDFVADVTEQYEEVGPVVLAPGVVRQRRWVERLLVTKQRASQRRRLLLVAGQLSGQLSYMAVNLGRFGSARAYGAEAFHLAEALGDDGLKAWVRGTESLAAYYDGRYDRSLALARDGQRYAKGGRQAVRLAVNGEARALGQLGDRCGVEEAVGRAHEIAGGSPAESGMTPCISFGLYSEARTASNAATAYLALSDTARVLEHAERAGQVADASSSVWSRALVRLDTATALARAKHPDLERVTALGREAMAIAGSHRLESIQQRARALAAELRPWQAHRTVRDFQDEAYVWLSQVWQRGHGQA